MPKYVNSPAVPEEENHKCGKLLLVLIFTETLSRDPASEMSNGRR